MNEIHIGDRVIPVALSTFELITIQEEIGCTVAQLRDEVLGITEAEEPGKDGRPNYHFGVMTDPVKMKKFGTLIRIIGNAGLEEAGEEPDLTDKWVLRHLKPGMLLPMAIVIMAVVNDSMRMETAKAGEENKEPVDVTIEEERRKKAPRK
jgi:hypothetical protein